MYRMSNKIYPAVLVIFGLFASVAHVAAQDFPTRPIRLIVPFPPGGATDLTARFFADRVAKNIGQPIVIDNRPGGNTIIATQAVVRAQPDGYTLLWQTNNLTGNPFLYKNKKLPFDTMKDLVPISLLARGPHVLAVTPSLPVKNVAELIALAKSEPEKLMIGSTGIGTVNHLAGAMFNTQAGIKMSHIPYKGASEAMPDLIQGRLQVMFPSAMGLDGYVEAGQVKALAVTGSKRSTTWPDVPTIAEQGLPGYEIYIWWGVLAPANTPAAIIDKLNAEFVKAGKELLSDPRAKDFEVVGSTPEEFTDFLNADLAKMSKIISAAGASLD